MKGSYQSVSCPDPEFGEGEVIRQGALWRWVSETLKHDLFLIKLEMAAEARPSEE